MEHTTRQRRTTARRPPARDWRIRRSPGHAWQRKPSLRSATSLLLLLLLTLPALAGVVKIERMSPPPLDLEVPLPGTYPSISGDGRFIAFVSYADNLVPGDTNGKLDVFVAERQ